MNIEYTADEMYKLIAKEIGLEDGNYQVEFELKGKEMIFKFDFKRKKLKRGQD